MRIRAIGGKSAVNAAGRWDVLVYTGAPFFLMGKLDDGKAIGWAVLDLAGGVLPEGNTPILWDHDTSKPVGFAEAVTLEPGVGIKAVGPHIGSVAEGIPDCKRLCEAGYPLQASVDAEAVKYRRVPAGETVTVNGRSLPGPICLVQEWIYAGVSVLTWGADGETYAMVARRGQSMPEIKAASVETSVLKELFAAYPGKEAAIVEMLDQGLDGVAIKAALDALVAAENAEEATAAEKAPPLEEVVAAKKPAGMAARMAALSKLHPTHAAMCVAAVAAGKTDDQVAADVLRAELAAERADTARLRAEAAKRPAGSVAAFGLPKAAGGGKPPAPADGILSEEAFQANTDLRAEFVGSYGAYAACLRGVANGRIQLH